MRHLPVVLVALLALLAPQAARAADLTSLTTVPGRIVDAAPDRVLYLQNHSSLVVRDVAAGTETTVPVRAGRSVSDGVGRLIPGGVLFASRDGQNPPGYEIEQWRGGVVTQLGAFSGQLEVAGDFAVWHVSSTLVRRRISTGTSAVVTTVAADGGDVAANGDVAFVDLSGKAYRWRDGVTTLVSTGASSHPANGPLTDGSEVVLNRRNPECCGAQQGVITYGSGLQEHTLEGSLRDLWPEPRVDYAIDGGWIAYTRRDPLRNRMVVWTRDPAGAVDAVGTDPLTPAHLRIMDVAPDGHVMYSTGWPDAVYLAATGTRPFPVTGGLDRLARAFSAAGRWYAVREGDGSSSLLRVELDTWASPGPPAVTTQDGATFEVASSARTALIECRLDGAAWQPCTGASYADLDEGPHVFEARSTDTATGAVDSSPATVSWRIDRAPPEPFALTSPADGGKVFTTWATLIWEPATDAGTAIAKYRVHLDGKVIELGPEATTHAAQLAPGVHTWSVDAVDQVGNVRTGAARTFTIEPDSTPPEPFALTSPAPGAIVASTTPTFTWGPATDTGSGVQRYVITIDDQFAAAMDAPAHSYTPDQPLAAGAHTWQVRAWDALGAVRESGPQAFVVDAAPPVAVVRSVEAASTGETVHFDAGGSNDAESGIARHEWDLDGDGVFEVDTGTGGHVSRSYETAGRRVATLRVTDGAGRTATATTSVKIGLAPPSGGPPGISIEAGARFTNDAEVTIVVRWPLFSDAVLLSNDGGFEGATEQPLAGAYTWTLDSSGSELLPKTVYARFPGAGGPVGGAITYQDDIILDQTPPEITSARAQRTGRSHRLSVRAGDSTSGIATLHVTRDRRRPGKARPWRRTLRVQGRAAPRWVRATDHAGNRTKWRRIKLRR